ncbi:hypothetical protein [Methanobrevibacter sp.]
MVERLIDEMEKEYVHIKKCREEIASLKEEIALRKAPLWEEATGTVDAKKDYIKFKLADLQYHIDIFESEIEYAMNKIEILEWRIMYKDD